MPGWYPDPAGAPRRFRFWDGRTWSDSTTDTPGSTPPPGGPSAGPTPGRRPGRGRRTAVVVLALGVVVVLIAALVLPRLLGSRDVVDPAPTGTQSAFDDSRATPTPTPTPSATPTPTPTTTPSASLVDCPVGEPLTSNDHLSDGRIHGGGLSFAPISGWTTDGQMTSGLSWAYDVHGQYQKVAPRFISLVAVGALRTADGFESAEQSAEIVVQCASSSDYYRSFTTRTDLSSQAVTVDGKPGWAIRTEIRIEDAPERLEGDVLEVIIVDLGHLESLAMFVGAVPIDDAARLKILDRTIASVKVE